MKCGATHNAIQLIILSTMAAVEVLLRCSVCDCCVGYGAGVDASVALSLRFAR